MYTQIHTLSTTEQVDEFSLHTWDLNSVTSKISTKISSEINVSGKQNKLHTDKTCKVKCHSK